MFTIKEDNPLDILKLKVKHSTFGVGTIIEFNGNSFTVQFTSKSSRFSYPDAFEKFLKFEDADIQLKIIEVIQELKHAESVQNALNEEARIVEMERRKADKVVGVKNKKVKDLDLLFSEDYHVAHLARQPILTYRQVEEQFGIKIKGFGRGINVTSTAVILISSIRKTDGNFVYHDRWTEDGDYLYSGEGKRGDQSMSKGNLAILNAEIEKKSIHLFVKFSPQEYYYQGVFKLKDYVYENDIDINNDLRKEYKFRLRKVD